VIRRAIPDGNLFARLQIALQPTKDVRVELVTPLPLRQLELGVADRSVLEPEPKEDSEAGDGIRRVWRVFYRHLGDDAQTLGALGEELLVPEHFCPPRVMV
jgi:hypothetical protein